MVLGELLDVFHLLEVAFDFGDFLLHIDFKIHEAVLDVEKVIVDVLAEEG